MENKKGMCIHSAGESEFDWFKHIWHHYDAMDLVLQKVSNISAEAKYRSIYGNWLKLSVDDLRRSQHLLGLRVARNNFNDFFVE